MFSLEIYKELVTKDKELAKQYCLKYKNDIYAQCELILLDIAFFYENNLSDNYNNLKKIYIKIKDKIYKHNMLWFIINIAYELKDYKEMVKCCEIFLKTTYSNSVFIYKEIGRIAINKQANEAIENLKKLLFTNNDLVELEIERIITAIGEYCYKKDYKIELNDFFNKCYLLVDDKNLISKIQLLLSIHYSNNDEETINLFNDFKKQERKENFFEECIALVYSVIESNFDLTFMLLRELEKEITTKEEQNNFDICKASACYFSGQYRRAYIMFTDMDQEYLLQDSNALYIKGFSIYFLDDRRLFNEGIESLNLAIKLGCKDELKALNCLKYLYLEVVDYEKVNEVIEYTNKKYGVMDYRLKALCVSKNGDFDLAFDYIKKAHKLFKEYSTYYNFYKKYPDKVSKKIFKSYEKLEDDEDYRQLAIMYLHGFGVTNKIDLDRALECALKASEKGPLAYCNNSVLGNVYLAINKYKEAFDVFKEGYEAYINYEENCTCCLGFYCYCLMMGIGTKKNENKAYEILDSIDLSKASDICVYSYAYLCLKRNENLEDAYNKLLNVNEYRYDQGKYFLLIKLAKKLNRDYTEYETRFNMNMEYLPVREREHYLNNQEIFYLTNI